jgi:gluconokinase
VESVGDPLVLAVDLGTSSARAFAYDAAGRRYGGGGAQVRYAWATTPGGGAEADAAAIVSGVEQAVDGAVAALGADAARVVAVGTAALWHSLVGVGADGAAVTPVYPWNDNRPAAAAAALAAELDRDAVHARTGAELHPSYAPAKLRWLRATEPDAFRAARHWMSLPEYVQLRLTGERRASVSIASGTGLFDQHRCAWDGELLAAAGVDAAQLSAVVDLDAPPPPLRAEYRARWPALAGARWLPALGDGACANVGSGCVGANRVAVSLGTSGAVRVLWDAGPRVRIPPGVWCYRLDRAHVVMGGAVSNGGNVYAWLARTLGLPAETELEAALSAREADAHGLTVLPFLAGERSPRWPERARGTVHGLTLDTTAVDVAQAALEAVVYRLALIRRLVAAELPAAGPVVASGAALASSPFLAQTLADALGEPVLLAADEEASARGAAIVALATAGVIPALDALPAPAATELAPDPARHARHAAAMGRYEAWRKG